MPALRIEGYVIVSADGMLANAHNVMPDELKFEGDKRFFTAALDRADLIVHGRNSHEDQPNSPRRKRMVLTREGCGDRARSVQSKRHTVESGRQLVRGRLRGTPACLPAPSRSSAVPPCSDMFMDRYDTFWLSQAPQRAAARWRTLLPRRA